jgi:hypothetical protein
MRAICRLGPISGIVCLKTIRKKPPHAAAQPGSSETGAGIVRTWPVTACLQRRQELIEHQRAERRALSEQQEQRQNEERGKRQKRFRSGIRGIWDRLSGDHKRIRKQNEREFYEAFIRYRMEKEEIISRHLEQQRNINSFRVQERNEHQVQKQELRQDVQKNKGMFYGLREQRLEKYSRKRQSRKVSREPESRGNGRYYD